MKLKSKRKGMIMLEFPNTKELCMTMGRAQEYYESGHAHLRNKVFTLEEFIDTFTDENGVVSYYSDWSGFNIPGDKLQEFDSRFCDWTKRELKLLKLIDKHTKGMDKFYVIAAKEGDVQTMDHEIAHAMFYLDDDYRKAASKLVAVMDPTMRQKMEKIFLEWGYARQVWVDELNAYMATSPALYMRKKFGLTKTAKHMRPFIDLFETHSAKWK